MKKKLSFSDMIKAGIEYHAFQRVKNAYGSRGCRYVLSKPLNPDQVVFISKFKNVILSGASLKYAPEIKYDTLIIFDKCIHA